MKILATTLGETAGDFISMTLGLGYYAGLGITFTALAVILYFQITSRFHPLLFWTAIIATTTAGTEISDFMDRSLGLGYLWGSLILTAGLAGTLAIWYARNRSLSVYPIVRRDEELLFWVAVLFSNSLGTAFGDFLVDEVGLSFIQGALVTAGRHRRRRDRAFSDAGTRRAAVLDRVRVYAAVRSHVRRFSHQAGRDRRL